MKETCWLGTDGPIYRSPRDDAILSATMRTLAAQPGLLDSQRRPGYTAVRLPEYKGRKYG